MANPLPSLDRRRAGGIRSFGKRRRFIRRLHDHRDLAITPIRRTELDVAAMPDVVRERMLDPMPSISRRLPFEKQRGVQRPVDEQVRIDHGVGATGAFHQIPEFAVGDRRLRSAQRLSGAFPRAELAVIALAVFRTVSDFQAASRMAAAAGCDAEQRLFGGAGTEDGVSRRGLAALRN